MKDEGKSAAQVRCITRMKNKGKTAAQVHCTTRVKVGLLIPLKKDLKATILKTKEAFYKQSAHKCHGSLLAVTASEWCCPPTSSQVFALLNA